MMKYNCEVIKNAIIVMREMLNDYKETGDIHFYYLYLQRSCKLSEYVAQFDVKTIAFISKIEANILNKYLRRLNER